MTVSTESGSPPSQDTLPGLGQVPGAAPAALPLPPLRVRTRSFVARWSGVWRIVALALIGACLTTGLLFWQIRDLPRDRLVPLLVEAFLISATLFVAILHLSRSSRAYDVAEGLVHKTAEDLAIAYASLARANDALRETGAARDRALEDLEAAARQQEVLLASLSHDLMNPLTVISGQAQLLQQRIEQRIEQRVEQRAEGAPEHDAWLIDGLAGIAATSNEMAELITELRDLAQLQSGQPLPLNPLPTDLVALTRDAVTEHAQSTSRHRFRLDVDPPAVVGLWDPTRLRRVVANLLANAVKYSPAGGEIDVQIRQEAGTNGVVGVIVIRDEGIGIPAGDLPYVFEWFHRAANVVDRVPGTGLGLAGAKQIVEGHGGIITVESEEGAGATFAVRLPLAGPNPEPRAPAPSIPRERGAEGEGGFGTSGG